MKIITIVSLVLSLATFSGVVAQQTPLSNFYNFNEYLLNPAEAGYRNRLEGSMSQRLQWQGIEGAPKTTYLGIHGALNEKMGFGGRVFLDQTDILRQFSAALSYSYRIELNDKAKLNFGVSTMLLQNSINYGKAIVEDESDEIINASDQSGILFDADAGLMLEYGNGKIGISTSHLFESGIEYELMSGSGTFERIRQFTAYGSYLFDLSEDWSVEPFFLLRNQGPKSFQYEVSSLFTYKQTLLLSIGYRQSAGILNKIGFQVTDRILAAYSYEFSRSGVALRSNGSHEFMVGYNLVGTAKNNRRR